MSDEELREKLAAIEHERWADWQKWCHQVLRENMGANADLEKILERWDRQIATPYSELSDQEKASDMEQVDRYWHLIEAYKDQALTAYKKELLSKAIPVWRMNVYGKSKVTDEVIPVSAIQEDDNNRKEGE